MTPQEEIQVRQMIARQREAEARQPMLREMTDMNPAPRITIATPEAEQAEYRRQMMALQDAARLRGLLGSNFDQFNMQRFSEGMERDRLARQPLESERAAYMRRARDEQDRLAPRINPDGTPVGGEVAADPQPEEYDGFVDSGTGQRGFMGGKYMPTPMDTSVAMAQAAPVSTAYNAPLVASTAYMPPPTAAPVNTAYMPPPTAAPVNTAYMPPPTAAPVNTAYNPIRRSPSSASTGFNPQAAPTNTAYMPSSAQSYGMSTPTYGMSTPTYGMAKAPTYREQASYSPNQAGKYKVDGPRLRNTGGLFNDLNAFFGRPQT